ncbi:conserved domain protein [Peptoniphilus sp. oral taxon 375 str. F0436]|nr:conserved domain protein [Peptoniphilus sp. oral taxon 375 str. F0436]
MERDIKQKYDNDKITEFALEKYKEVNKPFYYGGYFSEDILFFVNIFITVLSLICILISSQCIVEDKENYLDSIFRTTRNGRNKYICSKILALASIISLYLILNISIYYGTIKYLYTNGLDSSFQMLLFNQLSISNLTIGKVILSVFLLSILFTIASSMMSIFVAINSKVSMVSSAISSVLFFIPSLLYGKKLFKSIFYFLPSMGLGTAENSLIEQYQKFEFVKLPGKILWIPKFLVIMALINIALYLLLSIKSYNKIEQ